MMLAFSVLVVKHLPFQTFLLQTLPWMSLLLIAYTDVSMSQPETEYESF